MDKRIEKQIKKHEDAIEYHKKQIERLNERQKLIDEMNTRGCKGYSISDFKNNVYNKLNDVQNELKGKTFKKITVGGKTFYATSEGEIYSEVRKYKCAEFRNGYNYATLNGEGNYVHRVIWEAFNGKIPEGMEIDHINTIRTDNRLENLRLVSSSENKRNPITLEKYKQSNKNKGIVRYRNEKS